MEFVKNKRNIENIHRKVHIKIIHQILTFTIKNCQIIKLHFKMFHQY
jgi:hypothetical protein